MDSRILIRSHLSKWPAYLTGFIGVLFLAGGVALAAIPNGIWFGGVVAIIGLGCFMAAFYMEANRVKQLMWLTLHPSKFTVTDNIGERTFDDDDIVSVALQVKDNFSNGNHVSRTCTFRVWVVSHQDKPELIEMKNTIKLSEADRLQPFVERVVRLLKQRADDDRQKNLSILGEGWELTSKTLLLRHPDTEESETPLSDIVATMCVDDKLKLWKRGEDEAFASLPLHAANAHLLSILLQEELSKRPDDAKHESTSQLGRIIFERRGNRSLGYLLLTLAILFLIIGGITLASFLFGWGKKNDQHVLIIVTAILWTGAVVFFLAIVAIFKQLFRCHLHGVYHKGFFGEKQLLYSELDAFSYAATKHYHKGSYVGTNIALSFFPRTEVNKPRIVYGTSIKNVDHSLDEMRDEIACIIGTRLFEEVKAGRPTIWTENMTLELQGIRYKASTMFGRQPEQTLSFNQVSGHNMQDGNFTLYQRGKPKPVMTEKCSARNFYSGYFAFQALLELHRHQPAIPVAKVEKPSDPYAANDSSFQE
ncbi:MAG: hypothetical protein U0796_15420 [Gemmatales bacterium]